MKTAPKTLTTSVLLGIALLVAAVDASAQTVVNRARTGGYAEDITYVTSGALKDQVVMMNGLTLYSVEMTKKGVLTRVCKYDDPEFDQFATGFTFVPTEGLFVLNNDSHPDKLYLFDQACASKGTRTIQYLDGNYRPGHVEGLAYIPNDSPTFPDHLIMAVWDALGAADVRLEILRRDGVVVEEIHRPDWPTQLLSGGGLGDVPADECVVDHRLQRPRLQRPQQHLGQRERAQRADGAAVRPQDADGPGERFRRRRGARHRVGGGRVVRAAPERLSRRFDACELNRSIVPDQSRPERRPRGLV